MYFFGAEEDIPKIKIFDKWMKQCGFVFSKRSNDQQMSTYYLNSALIKETIENNQVTAIYQNGQRLRSGKIHRKLGADMSVRWLLEAQFDMEK